MFFSADQLYSTLTSPVPVPGWNRNSYIRCNNLEVRNKVSKHRVRQHVSAVKRNIVERVMDDNEYKWLRPWDIVPKLREYQPPAGQFGVGIEVELPFISYEASRTVARHIQNMRHITIDNEGGTYPLEVTFPPIVSSKMNNKCQVARYFKYLNSTNLVNRPYLTQQNRWIGIHVNVSKGEDGTAAETRGSRCDVMSVLLRELNSDANLHFFGRVIPYNYAVWQGRYVEFKMFHSTTDFAALKRYVNISVALADLLFSERALSLASLMEALEAGYNKRV